MVLGELGGAEGWEDYIKQLQGERLMVDLHVSCMPLTQSPRIRAAKWGINNLGDFWSC